MKSLGFDSYFKGFADKFDGLYWARVISQSKGLYTLICENTEVKAEVSGKFIYNVQKLSDYPIVGDFVMIDRKNDENGNAIIHYVIPRKSIFSRKAAGNVNEEQAVAANIDTVFICMSLNNDFNLKRLERYLTIGYDSGAIPVVVLTKSDLCENLEKYITDVEKVCIGTDIIVISSMTGDGYDKILKYILPEKTVAFVGSSGVGKSTVINKLIGREVILTNGLRNDDKGRHTTTSRNLFILQNGAMVIDTPGMRELGILENNDSIDKAFSDIEKYFCNCKYSDCTHTNEPGCAVIYAIKNGELSESRWKDYLQLKAEANYMENKLSYLTEKKNKFKMIAKINKSNRKVERK